MSDESRSHRLIGAAGALAAGLGGIQASDAGVISQTLGIDVPSSTTKYPVDLDSDGFKEFDIQIFSSLIKVAGFAPGASVLRDPSDDRTANVPAGAIIGSGSGVYNTTGPDHLSGTDPGGPVGHFQTYDGPGYIGVQFEIDGSTHYGYVGYEGTGAPNSANGRIYSIGYEDIADKAIAAGSTFSSNADADGDGDVDGNDFLRLQRRVGNLYTGADFALWEEEFGQSIAVSVPEPAAGALLAAGAAALAIRRRRGEDA